ncbi:MAG: DUF1559 domain-containing protein [Fuerstiella sp.]
MIILLPAIQRARERSRATVCRSNLRQLGVAAHQFESVHHTFPGPGYVFRQLLPYLEQEALARRFDRLDDPSPRPFGAVPVLICPSDPFASAAENHTSYRMNMGTDYAWDRYDGLLCAPKRVDGKGFLRAAVTVQMVRDGLSNTALFSERLVQPPVAGTSPGPSFDRYAQRHEMRFLWWPRRTYPANARNRLGADCQLRSERITAAIPRSDRDRAFNASGAYYMHISGPNTFGCFHLGAADRGGLIAGGNDPGNASTPATSQHSTGVHVTFGDGAVRFVANQVDLNVWQALGTRAGGEAVSLF